MRLPRRLTKRAKPAYRSGDVLKLESGGRPMTVTWSGLVLFAPGNWLICQWFSDAGELRQEMFPEETLERASHMAAA
ncbi:YodC family protein [Paraburkholderia xenovorans]|uniref:YodC family protein n=1 Tax=Paraburkholderia xenovorans TaxID=36873 RepID=UPI001558E63B|nr:YodC family protein [Paraburkholderia xenovorans]NPT33476.1 DUF2158 domain-containing protein [Paraburkholderia xenovorans]